MSRFFARSTRCKTIGAGAKKTFPIGWVMGAFEYRQAEEIRDAFRAPRRSISVQPLHQPQTRRFDVPAKKAGHADADEDGGTIQHTAALALSRVQ